MRKIGPNVKFKTKSRVDLDVTKYIEHFEQEINKGKPWESPMFFNLFHEITSIYLPNKDKSKKHWSMKNTFEDIETLRNLSSTIDKFVDECNRPSLDKDYFHAVRKTLK